MMLGFHSRDKWSLNKYDAIEIKSKGFYAALKCNNTKRSVLDINIESAKCNIFFISVHYYISHEKRSCFVRWLSITNIVAKPE